MNNSENMELQKAQDTSQTVKQRNSSVWLTEEELEALRKDQRESIAYFRKKNAEYKANKQA